MLLRLLFGLLVALSLSAPALAQQRPQALPIAAIPTKPWKHRATGVSLPPAIAGYRRGAIVDISNGAQIDVNAAYTDAASGTETTVYLYHPALPNASLWFDASTNAIMSVGAYGVVAPATDAQGFTPPNQSSASGLRRIYTITQRGRSTAIAFVPLGPWMVKLRMTSARLDPPALDAALGQIIAGIGWPRRPPAAIAATPIADCARSIAIGTPATRAPASTGATLTDALVHQAGRAASDKLIKAGKPIPFTSLCRDPAAVAGGFSLYQDQASGGGYVMPLGDSGLLLSVGRDNLGTLLAQAVDAQPTKTQGAPALAAKPTTAPEWTVSLLLPDRWMVFPHFVDMPLPEQALKLIQSERPLAQGASMGKDRQIHLSSQAVH